MAQEIRNYRITANIQESKTSDGSTIIETVEAYDLNEALVQVSIKYQDFGFFKVIDAIPFKYIEEQKPAIEQKKEVHVKPLPKVTFTAINKDDEEDFNKVLTKVKDEGISMIPFKSPDTD